MIVSIVFLFLGVIALILWMVPGNRSPFDYMVAGTFATAVALTALWALTARGAR